MGYQLSRQGHASLVGLLDALIGVLVRDMFDHTLHTVHNRETSCGLESD